MRMLFVSTGALVTALLTFSIVLNAEEQGRDNIQRKLEGYYQLTKTTDDKSDIVTAGSVIVLHKDKVLMVAATSTANPCMNTYKDGRIVAAKACGVGEKIKKFGRFIPGSSAPSIQTRNFVSGEKFWVTKIDVRNNGVVFDFFTDAINDTRYIAALTIPFGAFTPSPEEALKVVQEVITVDDTGDAKEAKGGSQQGAPQGAQQAPPAAPAQVAAPVQASAQATPAPAEAPPPPIEAPPPPPADPVEIQVGQTPEQVVAALGQPLRKAKTSTKEIYFYKDLKVTFVNGKVKDVE
jgi:hypothetical protein